MKQQKPSNEKGIAHLGVIVAVIVTVAIVSFGGWFVWDRNEKDGEQKDNSTQTTDSSQNQAQQSETAPADPSEGGKYLVIEEWGVRFLLPEELRGDVYYKSWTNASGNYGVSFASKRLDELVGDESCSVKTNADGTHGTGLSISLGKLNPAEPGKVTVEFYRSQFLFITKIDSFEYYYPKQTKNPPVTCLTNQHEQFNDLEQSISNQLKAALTTLEKVN